MNTHTIETLSKEIGFNEQDYLELLSSFHPKIKSNFLGASYETEGLEIEYKRSNRSFVDKLLLRFFIIVEFTEIVSFISLIVWVKLTLAWTIIMSVVLALRLALFLYLQIRKLKDSTKQKIYVFYWLTYIFYYVVGIMLLIDSKFENKEYAIIRCIWLGGIFIYISYCLLLPTSMLAFIFANIMMYIPIGYSYYKDQSEEKSNSFVFEVVANFLMPICYYFMKYLDMIGREKFETSQKNAFLIDNYKKMISNLGCSLVTFHNEQIIYANPDFHQLFKSKYESCSQTNTGDHQLQDYKLFFQKLRRIEKNDSVEEQQNLLSSILTLNYHNLTQSKSGQGEEFKDFESLGFYELECEFGATKIGSEFESPITLFHIFKRHIKLYDSSVFIEVMMHDLSSLKIAKQEALISKSTRKIFSNIAHEFKTPLLSITSLVESLQDGLRNSISPAEITIISKQLTNISEYTIYLINDIILYSENKMKLIDLKLVKEFIPFTKIINFCKSMLDCLLEFKQKDKYIISYVLSDERLTNAKVRTDEIRLKQILLNFISNAVKFTNAGKIEIECTLDSENSLDFRIKDTGCGLSQDNLNKIVYSNNDRIVLDVNSENNRMGTGLGLQLSFELCRRLKFQTLVESNEGKGSSFGIHIPFSDLTELSLQNEAKNESDDETKTLSQYFQDDLKEISEIESKWKILVADDSIHIRKAISKILKELSNNCYEIIECSDGLDLINRLIEDQVNGCKVKFVFSDECMKFLNGSDAFRLIKKLQFEGKLSKIDNLKLISITANDSNDVTDALRKSGADYVFMKPLQKSEVTELLLLNDSRK